MLQGGKGGLIMQHHTKFDVPALYDSTRLTPYKSDKDFRFLGTYSSECS